MTGCAARFTPETLSELGVVRRLCALCAEAFAKVPVAHPVRCYDRVLHGRSQWHTIETVASATLPDKVLGAGRQVSACEVWQASWHFEN